MTSIRQQIHNNAVALISLFVAKKELTGAIMTARKAVLQVLQELE